MQLEELLQWLSLSQKTGTLQFGGEKLTKKIFFKDGLIVASSSNRPEEYLGHFLVSRGLINEQTLSKAIELQEATGMLLGKILTTRGWLTDQDLHSMLRLKTEESIYDIFSWEEGEFEFVDGLLPESQMVPMALEVTGIIMEGVQRVDELRRIRKLIPNGNAIPVQIAEWNFEDLNPGQRQVLELVDDERTVEDIRLQTHSSEFHVARVFYRQWQEGRLKVVKPRVRDLTGPQAMVVNGPVTGQALRDTGQTFLEKGEFEPALRHLRAARNLDPDDHDIQNALAQAEKVVRVEIEKSGVTLVSIPQLSVGLEQLTSSKLSSQEGFLLTRINGSYDIQSILKITPMPQLDALLVFWKLLRGGFIKMTVKKK